MEMESWIFGGTSGVRAITTGVYLGMISDELKAQTSGGDGRKRNEGTRKSLRSSANRFAASIRKKVSTLENSVGFRRAFSPLSDDSPNTTIVGPDEISYIDGRRYEFRDGGLMKTPDASPSPWGAHSNPVRFKTQLSYGLQLKASNGKKEHNLRERLAKQLARCRIWQHGSPMVGRRACRGSKRKLQLGNGRLLDENQKENESPKLLAIGRVSSSKVNRRHLF
ncbi:unnamed protein product [Toxocara canis]|uniref:Uncharacterized protein n=1 Tax=Toxocara canis TaxID=6265 RepID=A0A183UBG1_TOXCA|nr:unnamed protein product [Toxocara canis]